MIGLEEPIDAQVSVSRLREATSPHALTVLEQDQKLIVVQDLADDCLSDEVVHL